MTISRFGCMGMKVVFIILVCSLLAILCSCKFSNEAVLVDPEGHFYYGKVTFNPEYQTGKVTFSYSPFGELAGPFIIVTTDEKDPVIKLKNIPLQKYSGKAQLADKNKRCLECDITAEFKTSGMGDMKMIGCGTCYDEKKSTYDISFQ
jgi:hypothetical protein